MAMIPISSERMAQLEEFAHRRGQDMAAALDEVLAEYLACEERDFHEAIAAVSESRYADQDPSGELPQTDR